MLPVEWRRCRGLSLERVAPGRLQVDRVGQRQQRLPATRLRILGMTPRVWALDPGVDGLDGAARWKSTLCGAAPKFLCSPARNGAFSASALLDEQPVGQLERGRLRVAIGGRPLLGGDVALQPVRPRRTHAASRDAGPSPSERPCSCRPARRPSPGRRRCCRARAPDSRPPASASATARTGPWRRPGRGPCARPAARPPRPRGLEVGGSRAAAA